MGAAMRPVAYMPPDCCLYMWMSDCEKRGTAAGRADGEVAGTSMPLVTGMPLTELWTRRKIKVDYTYTGMCNHV